MKIVIHKKQCIYNQVLMCFLNMCEKSKMCIFFKTDGISDKADETLSSTKWISNNDWELTVQPENSTKPLFRLKLQKN